MAKLIIPRPQFLPSGNRMLRHSGAVILRQDSLMLSVTRRLVLKPAPQKLQL